MRHGQGVHNQTHDWSMVDPKLTDKGVQQAASLTTDTVLALTPSSLLVVSPLSRAIQTAALAFPAITEHPLPCRVVLTRRHTERWSAACDEGRPKSHVAEDFPFIRAFEGFEELPELWTVNKENDAVWESERVPAFVEWVRAQPEHHVVAVGHGAFFQALCGQYLGNCQYFTLTHSQHLVLVRHGHGEHDETGNMDLLDPPLSETGRTAAAALKKEPLLHLGPETLLVVSPLRRVVQTAALAFPSTASGVLPCRMVLTPLHTNPYSAQCDAGVPKSQLLEEFPFLRSWEGVEELEEEWSPNKEADASWETTRVPAFLQWLATQPHRRVVVLGHSRFFKRICGMDFAHCRARLVPNPSAPTPTQRIFFVRTAESTCNEQGDWSIQDPDLSSGGQAQGTRLREEALLQVSPKSLIVVGPLSRAVQTAVALYPHLAEEPSCKVALSPLVTQRWGNRCDEGLPKSELVKKFPFLSRWEGFDALEEHWSPTEGSESNWKDSRVNRFLSWLHGRTEEHIVVVTHNEVINPILGKSVALGGWAEYQRWPK